MAMTVKPMGIGELLDGGFRIYRSRFLTMFAIVAVVQIPVTILISVLQRNVAAAVDLSALSGAPGVDPAAAVMASLLASDRLTLMGVTTLLSTVAFVLQSAAMAVAVSREYLGQPATFGDAYGRALSRLWPLLVAAVLGGLTIVLGFVLLVVPGIAFIVWYFFSTQAVVLEGRGGRESLGRSRRLVQGSWWRVVGITLLTFILVGVIQAVLGSVLGVATVAFGGLRSIAMTASLPFQVASAALSALVTPVQLAVLTLLYYDLRIRKEGFDLEQMAAQVQRLTPA